MAKNFIPTPYPDDDRNCFPAKMLAQIPVLLSSDAALTALFALNVTVLRKYELAGEKVPRIAR